MMLCRAAPSPIPGVYPVSTVADAVKHNGKFTTAAQLCLFPSAQLSWHLGARPKCSKPSPNNDVMGFLEFVVVYVLGGLTFLPLLFCALLLHAHLTFPTKTKTTSVSDSVQDSSDDGTNIKSTAALADLGERFQRGHEPDVAAGYFAVCREYVPGGVNGKPPERTTPAGTTDVAPESLSVYQSMYRSIFDRRQGPTLDLGKGNGKPAKRARNVFFVVLRHGHLMLYDDSEQLDPRHVIFLEHHDVSIYGGDEEIPEGELFIKRNSIRLARKAEIEDSFSTSKPFYFFSENCSDKEDFYFALLHNQEAKSDAAADGPPRPQQYDVKHIITLVQKLHSSEEQLQTRWINGLIGRLFLALYKTNEVEDFLRSKITKKIARVKKPAFLSRIVLRKIDMGEGAPYITNPRLKDLTIDGDCCAEADFKYAGNFRLEIAATARIDLGARFKAREVDLVLAVVVKKLEGHALLKFKPPPSNRIWISFETMPYIDMSIEPIVSSRQITYNIILRAIENRIREVIAETIVLPHWDDSPFTDTSNEPFRGGIWARSSRDEASKHMDIPDEIAEDEAEANTITLAPAPSPRSKEERTMSLPVLPTSNVSDHSPAKIEKSAHTSRDGANTAVSTGVRKRLPEPPKAMRARSFANAADPLVSMDNANVEKDGKVENEKRDMKYPDATSTMMAISQRSPPMSPTETPMGSSREQPTLWETSISRSGSNSISSASSKPSSVVERTAAPANLDDTFQVSTAALTTSSGSSSHYSPANLGHKNNGSASSIGADSRASASFTEKKYSTASLGAATAAAKKWGWNVITRNADANNHHDGSQRNNRAGTPEHPIGRGQPLPPLGQPLPFPERKSQFSLPKRKPIPLQHSLPKDQHRSKIEDSPALPQRKQDKTAEPNGKMPPALPRRRRKGAEDGGADDADDILVVEAPVGSEPSSPLADDRKSFVESSETYLKSKNPSSSPKHGDENVEEAHGNQLNLIEKTLTAMST